MSVFVLARECDDIERDVCGDEHGYCYRHAGVQQGPPTGREVPSWFAAAHDTHHRPYARR
ncbi:jg6513, partial [Pararge aegeria aegeria]